MVNRTPAPFNQDRCDELDAMRSRGLELRGRRKTAHYVRALEASDTADLQRYQVWKDREEFDKKLDYTMELPIAQDHNVARDWDTPGFRALLAQRQDRMFASTYKEDPARKTFLDLPGEIRNKIYYFALFSPHGGTVGKIHLLVANRQFLM
jgi:hypothetical protein